MANVARNRMHFPENLSELIPTRKHETYDDPQLEVLRLRQDRWAHVIFAGILLVINSLVLRSHLSPTFHQKAQEQSTAILKRLQDVSPGVPNYDVAATGTSMWASWANLSFSLSLLLAVSCLFAVFNVPCEPIPNEPANTTNRFIRNTHTILDVIFASLFTAMLFFIFGLLSCLVQPSSTAWNIFLWILHLRVGAFALWRFVRGFQEVAEVTN